jgi:FKBP-type peptidyl-prolyl cis-trans isomerase FkpA
MRTLTPLAILLTAVLGTACGSPVGPSDRWAEPETIEFAVSLNVDLTQMNRTASGLYWQDLEVGTGLAAEIGHTVIIHYNVWLPDGTLVDSSYGKGAPIEFPVHGGIVIAGMDEGVVGMQLGGRRKLVVRPELAYGRRGRDPVPPLTTLVFEVELVSIRI